MSAESGEMFVCDRAEKAHANGEKTRTFMLPEDKARDDWEEVNWTDVNGVSIKMLLCPECRMQYGKIRAEQRSQTQQFMYASL